MFSSRAAAQAFIPHTALPRQSRALSSTSLRICKAESRGAATAQTARKGMGASSGREMRAQLMQSHLQTLRISAAAIPLPHWQERAALVKNLARTGSAVTSFAAICQPGEPSPSINLCMRISK